MQIVKDFHLCSLHRRRAGALDDPARLPLYHSVLCAADGGELASRLASGLHWPSITRGPLLL